MKWSRVACVTLLAGLFCSSLALGGVVDVSAEPASQTVAIDSFFDVFVVMDAPDDSIVGWGIDVWWDDAIINLVGLPEYNTPPWDEASNIFDEPGLLDLAALTFPPGESGNDLLLVTLHFKAIAIGETDVVPSHTVGDATEGFALDYPPGGFADATYHNGHVIVTPEPTTLALLAFGCLGLIRGRR